MTFNKTSLRKVFVSDFAVAFYVIALWHISLVLIGVAVEQVILKSRGLPTPGINSYGLLTHTARWDSGWLNDITSDLYRKNVASAVFYPLFPLLVAIIHKVSLGLLTIRSSGFILNVTASWLALVALFKIAKVHLKDKDISVLVALSFLAFPSAFFLHSFYTEALFCALGFWSYYFAVKRNWVYSSILLAFLTATRITSILFVLLCGLEYLSSKQWDIKKIKPDILWFGLAPTGFIAYASYLRIVRHDFLGMFHAYHAVTDWSYQKFGLNFMYPYLKAGYRTLLIALHVQPLDNSSLANSVFPFIALSILLAASIYAIFRIRSWALPLGLFGVASFIMFNLNGNTVSAHRYVLPCLVVYLVAGSILSKVKWKPARTAYALILGSSLMFQMLLFFLFVSGYFAG